jgi:hypothetical protein
MRGIGKPVCGGGDARVIFQGSHRVGEKGCGRRVGYVGFGEKAYRWNGLRREGLAQEEKRWWRVGRLRVSGVKT